MNDYATKTKLRTRAIVLQTVFPTQLTKAFGKYLGKSRVAPSLTTLSSPMTKLKLMHLYRSGRT